MTFRTGTVVDKYLVVGCHTEVEVLRSNIEGHAIFLQHNKVAALTGEESYTLHHACQLSLVYNNRIWIVLRDDGIIVRVLTLCLLADEGNVTCRESHHALVCLNINILFTIKS